MTHLSHSCHWHACIPSLKDICTIVVHIIVDLCVTMTSIFCHQCTFFCEHCTRLYLLCMLLCMFKCMLYLPCMFSASAFLTPATSSTTGLAMPQLACTCLLLTNRSDMVPRAKYVLRHVSVMQQQPTPCLTTHHGPLHEPVGRADTGGCVGYGTGCDADELTHLGSFYINPEQSLQKASVKCALG